MTYGLNSRRLFFVRGKSVDIYIETRGALLLDTLAEPHGSAVLGRVHGSSGSSVDLNAPHDRIDTGSTELTPLPEESTRAYTLHASDVLPLARTSRFLLLQVFDTAPACAGPAEQVDGASGAAVHAPENRGTVGFGESIYSNAPRVSIIYT